MLATEDFRMKINTFTLSFRSEEYEQAYLRARSHFNDFYIVIKWIIIVYAIVVSLVVVVLSILTFTNGTQGKSMTMVGVLVGCVFAWIIECVLSLFACTQRFRGVLVIHTAIIEYQIVLNSYEISDASLPGDLGLVVVLALIGMYMCYSWIIASVSYVIAMTAFVLIGKISRPSFTSTYRLIE
jgi:hypothetical protein